MAIEKHWKEVDRNGTERGRGRDYGESGILCREELKLNVDFRLRSKEGKHWSIGSLVILVILISIHKHSITHLKIRVVLSC